MIDVGRDAVLGYVYLDEPSIEHTAGPYRVVTDEPTTVVRRPVGFITPPRHRRAVPVDSPSLAP